jgi:alkaline phosphatase
VSRTLAWLPLAAAAALPPAAAAQAPPVAAAQAPLGTPDLAAVTRAADPWFQAGAKAVAEARALSPRSARARNVILFVGDGMNPTTVTAARILAGQQAGGSGEENHLSFEALPYLALAKTYNTDAQVPDSAGTMTALVSGVKTKAGVLGLSDLSRTGDASTIPASRVPTLFEDAEARGLATGIVTTARVTHATPAACYAHVADRDWESDADLPRGVLVPDIARQLVEFGAGDGIEVVLGGGRAPFLPASQPDPEEPGQRGRRKDGRDLVAEWQRRNPGGAYVWNRAQLDALDLGATPRLLGLFDPSHMEYEADRAADRGGEPSLAEMTAAALRILARAPKGFVLMVEAGRIDHAHHANNAFRALGETIELSRAVDAALRATSRADTLVVVTADHGHSFTLSGYPKRGNPILGLVVPPGGDAPLRDAAGLPYTALSYATGPGNTARSNLQGPGPKHFPHEPAGYSAARSRPDLSAVDTRTPDYLQEALVPLASGAHSGEDVAVYAGGPGAELFHGVVEQSYVYHAIADALGWTGGPAKFRGR